MENQTAQMSMSSMNMTQKPMSSMNMTQMPMSSMNMTQMPISSMNMTFTEITKTISSTGINTDTIFHKVLNQYLTGLVLIVGVITNGLIIAVMRKSTFRKLPLAIYFSALAISDTIVLLHIAMVQIVKQTTGINIYRIDVFCAFATFLAPGASMTSSWFVVCVAVERYLVVKFPLKAKIISTKNKALMAVMGVTSVSALLNSSSFWMVDYTKPKCALLPQFKWFSRYSVKAYLFLATYNVLPLIIISFCYLMVIRILRKKRQQVLTHSGASFQKLTTSAIMICLFFMILTMPLTISLSLRRRNLPETVVTQLFHDVAQFFRLLNYGTNFFIYFFCNIQFRAATKRLWSKPNSVQPSTTGQTY